MELPFNTTPDIVTQFNIKKKLQTTHQQIKVLTRDLLQGLRTQSPIFMLELVQSPNRKPDGQ